MRIAVTGASGFIGRYVIGNFLQRGYDVTAIGRDRCKLDKCFSPHTNRVETNFSLNELIQRFHGIDIVIHLSAKRLSPVEEGFKAFLEDNIYVTENVVRAACKAHVRRLCLASSISVYSMANTVPFKESEAPIPSSLYGISKLTCEHIAHVYSQRYPLEITSLRFSRIFGYGDNSSERMFMKFIQRSRNKLPLIIWGDGTGASDALYIKDAISAIEKAVHSNAPCGVFNVGGGRAFSHLEVADAINRAFNNQGNITFDASMVEDKHIYYLDCQKAENDLGWHRSWTHDDGLAEMRELYKRSSENAAEDVFTEVFNHD